MFYILFAKYFMSYEKNFRKVRDFFNDKKVFGKIKKGSIFAAVKKIIKNR